MISCHHVKTIYDYLNLGEKTSPLHFLKQIHFGDVSFNHDDSKLMAELALTVLSPQLEITAKPGSMWAKDIKPIN